MKIEVTYPVLTLEHEELEISPDEWRKIQEMSICEQAHWVYWRLEEEELPSWKCPAHLVAVESAFWDGTGKITQKTNKG